MSWGGRERHQRSLKIPLLYLPRRRLCRNSKTRRTVENCKHISVENNDVIPTFASSDIQSGIASCSFPSVALLRHSLFAKGIDVSIGQIVLAVQTVAEKVIFLLLCFFLLFLHLLFQALCSFLHSLVHLLFLLHSFLDCLLCFQISLRRIFLVSA